MRHKKERATRPFIAWGILREMLESFDDDQLMTLDGLVAGELSRRRNGEDPRQGWLLGGQALQAGRIAQ